MKHVVLDFNGTLFDDARVLNKADNLLGKEFGWREVTFEYYQQHSSRHFREYYSSLRDEPLTDDQMEEIDRRWHEIYETLVSEVQLVPDAHEVIDALHGHGYTTSICSMHPHNLLLEKVERFNLQTKMTRIDGLRSFDNGTLSKADHLQLHLREEFSSTEFDRDTVYLVGDNIDDGKAARANEINGILVATGEQSIDRLRSEPHPIAESLTEALQLIVSNSN